MLLLVRMKTTIEIPDALAEQARAHGVTLRELVVSGLRHEIARRGATASVDFRLPTMGGDALVTDLEPGQAIERSYGLP